MLDALQFWDGTFTPPSTFAGTAITVTRDSTNILDMGSLRDIGAGFADIEMHVQVIAAFTAAGSATMTVELKGAATVGGTYYPLIQSPLYAVADLTAGRALFRYTWPVNQLNNPNTTPFEFYKLVYTVATGPMTAGTVAAYITGQGDRQVYFSYPNNYVSA